MSTLMKYMSALTVLSTFLRERDIGAVPGLPTLNQRRVQSVP